MSSSKCYAVVMSIIVVLGFLMLVLGYTNHISYKRGYEEATKDFYNGNLKTELINQQVVVWKDEHNN